MPPLFNHQEITMIYSQMSRVVLGCAVLQMAYITTTALEDLTPDELDTVITLFKEKNKDVDLHNVIFDNNQYIDEYVKDSVTDNNRTGKTTAEAEQEHLEQINLGKRAIRDHRWFCEAEISWKNLGNLHYPRFVKESLCLGDSCMNGFYRCQAQYYPVRVLAARESGDDLEIDLPRILRNDWKFMTIHISVGCVCRN